MSGIEREGRKFSNHSPEIQTAAANWVVERQTSPDWDRDNQAALEAWLSQSVLHRVAFVRFDDAWHRSRRLAALRRPGRGKVAMAVLQKMNPVLRRIATAALGVAILGVGLVLLRPVPTAQVFSTSIGERETIILGDGSRIELNTDTALRVRDAADRRTVWLDRGEALFQIKHDIHRLLVVYAGDRRVTDFGTEFVVRRDADRLKVALLEGRVIVGSVRSIGPDTILEPGTVLLASGGHVSITKASPRTLTDALSWRRGLLVFNRASLEDAALEFNRYNREEIVIADPAVGQLVFDGSLPANNPEELAQIAHSFFGLSSERANGKIIIYRRQSSTN
jgi:transmembrane sensor